MKRIIISFLMVVLLSSCVPVALVAGAAGGAVVGGSIIYDKRTTSQMAEDRRISQIAHNTINADPMLKDKVHINIATFDGVVLMVGQAETPDLRDRAYRDAAQIPKIKRIYNEITIGAPSSFGQRSTDSWITTKVKSAMLAQKGLSSSQIKVVTESGVVYLMGEVTPTQARLATEVTRRVSGVVRVVKVFEITQ